MTIVLVGGGPDTTRSPDVVAPFAAACDARAARRVAVLLAGDAATTAHFFPEYAALLADVDAAVEPVPLSGGVDDGTLATFDAIVVGGGPTPLYLDGLVACAATIRQQVGSGLPYLGFSAGAMVTPTSAIVGGHRIDGVSVCPQEWSEGLDAVTVRPGLGVVPWAVDVHAAQAGTLGRAVAVVERRLAATSVAIDEDTALVVDPGEPSAARVAGSGSVWWARASGSGVTISRQYAGR